MRLKTTLSTIGLCAALIGCNSESTEEGLENGASNTINFDYQVSSLFQQTVSDSSESTLNYFKVGDTSSIVSRAFTSDQIMVGELQVTPTSGGVAQVFTWSIYLDEDTWEAESNLSIDLDPGAYDFELLLSKDDFQYVASTTYVVVDGTNDVPMTISPVIGDLVVNVSAVEELEDFKFQYSATELNGLTDPQIGVSVDGAAEQIFSINPTTGLSDTYLNLDDGAHHLDLRLYDANIQVGKSIDAQENVTIVTGQNINMDLVPLHAETQLILTEAGGDANVTVNLPQLVVDEVGGINNLQAIFAVVGAKNPLQETVLTFNPASGGYEANFILTDLQYDDLTVDITFNEVDSGENIGRCINTWTLSALSQTLNCEIQLRRRAVIGGSLLAVLGINVFNQGSEPVAGAVIKDQNDNILGITGSGTWGTKGYLKTYLKAGDYTITAEDQTNNLMGSEAKTLTPLDIENVLIVLNSPIQRIGTTCATIKADNPSSTGGIYTIDPDGDSYGVEPFDAYCDMTTQGGGWTLFAYHKDGHNQQEVDVVDKNTLGVYGDDRWVAIRDSITTGMMFIDENSLISLISKEKIDQANCTQINSIDTLLSSGFIMLDENSGCSVMGSDYTFISIRYRTVSGASIYQYSSLKFDVWPYLDNSSDSEQDELYYYIK